MDEQLKIPENANFDRLATIVGVDVATFCFCAYNDIKFDPSIEFEEWDEYVRKLYVKNEESRGFVNGITDVNDVLKLGMSDDERWLTEWGEGDENNPYTEKDYHRLDELYHTMSARLSKSGGMDEQQEHIIRSCCRMSLLAEKAIAKGDKESVDIATKLNKMIQDNLSSENLRKKDEKPVEVIKVDGVVEALKRKYGVGVELTYEQAIGICSQWLVSHEYPMTKDAAEEMLLSIINCTRQNNDEPEFDTLPKEYKFSEECTEFASLPNEMEMDAFRYLGIDT